MADWGSKGRVITQIFGNVFQTLGQDFGLTSKAQSSIWKAQPSVLKGRLRIIV